MKAILVIDVPVALEHLIGEEIILHISVESDGHYIMTEQATLKSMTGKLIRERVTGNSFAEGYCEGWNAFVDEITGKEE